MTTLIRWNTPAPNTNADEGSDAEAADDYPSLNFREKLVQLGLHLSRGGMARGSAAWLQLINSIVTFVRTTRSALTEF
jgi:hypothetical protein